MMQPNQSPRLRVVPDYVETAGDDAGYLGTKYGLTPDPWQQLSLNDCLAENPDGSLVAEVFAEAVPRQNGKNGILEIVELFKIAVQGRKILHTAHEVKTARKAFTRLCSFFENERKHPELAKLLASPPRRANGQEAIYLTNGGSVEFVARTRSSGRGFTVDDLVCDEAQELTDEQHESLLPTVSSAPSGHPQRIYVGTPPSPRSAGNVLPRLRKQVLEGKTDNVAWVEWSIPDDSKPEEIIQNWREWAYETNPALGRRLNESTVKSELSLMSPEGFCRERLGWWESNRSGLQAIDPKEWDACKLAAADAPSSGGLIAYGVRFSTDGSHVALAAARRLEKTGPAHVEAIRHEPMSEGTDWLVEFLAQRQRSAAQIVIDGRVGVGYLIERLREAGVRNKNLVITPTLQDVQSAHTMMDQDITGRGITTIESQEVERQVLSAQKRPIGRDGGFGWQAPEGGSVALLEAMTYANWGVKTTKRRPKGGDDAGSFRKPLNKRKTVMDL